MAGYDPSRLFELRRSPDVRGPAGCATVRSVDAPQPPGPDVEHIDAPAASAASVGRSMDVVGSHDGTHHFWPAGGGPAFARGWDFFGASRLLLIGVLVLRELVGHPAEEV